MLRYLTPLLFVACANPAQGVAIDRVVPDRADVNMPQPVSIEGTFHVLSSNLDEGDTTAALVTASVDTVPLDNTIWISEDQVTATMPGLAEGVYDVTVSLDGRRATLKDAYIVGNPPPDGGGGGSVTGTHSITVTGPIAGGPHTNFPLLVDLQDSRLQSVTKGGEVASDQGFDIFFSLDQAGTMHLSHEIEKYTVDGELVAWVKIPSLAPGFQFFIHMGDPSVTMPQGNPTDVWSEGYAAVWHMGPLQDATTNNNNAADSATVGIVDTGQIEQAHSFDGATGLATAASSASINDLFAGGGTIEVWLFPTSAGENALGRIVDRGPSFMVMSMCDANVGQTNSLLFGRTFSTTGTNWCTPQGSVPFNTWTHAVVVYSDAAPGNLPTIYLDGVAQTISNDPAPTGSRLADNATLAIGDRTTGGRAFAGNLDELRLSRTTRTAEWIRTTFDNQNDPGNFVTLGP